MRTDLSQNRYEITDWINTYSQWAHLLKPEEILWHTLKNQPPITRMLDIGIGGGRTTHFFAELTNEYIGIDFDEGMIQACEKRFPNRPKHVQFMKANAIDMGIFEDEYFDFILFSFNGLDYLPYGDRLKALSEIRRVGKRRGFFFFSTHNLNSIDRLFTIWRSNDPKKLLKYIWKYLILTIRNEKVKGLKSKEYTMIYDGVYSDKLSWLFLSIIRHLGYFYYSKPEFQVRQLKGLGFMPLSIYAMNGKEIMNDQQLVSATDYWLYYLCEILH
jgi:ubiquinone/menaquinone biosynthesis C-methylase UbiE